jgi:hypothetical protein
MAVKDSPLVWRTFPEEYVELIEGGTVATEILDNNNADFSHITTGFELTEGRHYWEVELLSEDVGGIYIGVTRPNLDPVGGYMLSECTDGWFIFADSGVLCGNGKEYEDRAGEYDQGDRVGVLLDLNNGSLLFFKNGVQHGPGYPAGSVMGPVVAAVEMYASDEMYGNGNSVRLHATGAFPAGHAQ